MSCAVVVVPASFSPSNNPGANNNNNNSNIYSSIPPMSPSNKNIMLKFQQLEGPFSSSSHYHQIHKELPLLKRKRPAKINVPLLSNLVQEGLAAFGTPRDCLVDTVGQEVEVGGDGYGVYCKRGRSRTHLEDRYSVIVNQGPANSNQAFFSIFDGHGGAKASEFAASRLGKNIMDRVGRGGPEFGSENFIQQKVREGYLATDEEFLRSENAVGGSCCATALIQQGKLIVSNVGDCRAVMSRGGVAEPLTNDHTPARQDEKMRIEAKGGYVDVCNGVWRIQGCLAVSRAIGDRHLKQWVTAEPDTKTIDIQPDCEFLILASDGFWDKVSNQEAIDMARPLCCASRDKAPELSHACRKLAELSISRGSGDDTSVMIVRLDQFVN